MRDPRATPLGRLQLAFSAVTIALVLGFKARGDFIPRDRIAVAVALLTALTLSASLVAVDQHWGAAGTLLALVLPLIGPHVPRGALVGTRPQVDR